MKFPQVIDLFRRTFSEDIPPVDITIQILNAYNDERTLRNITKLRLNKKLTLAAQNYGAWLNNHDHLDFVSIADLVLEASYQPRVIGENTAKGYTSVSSVMSAWMVSADHRRNILRPCYTEVGIAAFGQYWCAIFGDQGPTINGDIIVNLTGGPVYAPLCG